MIFRSVALAALTMAVAACATTPPKTMAFGPQSTTALLVSGNPELLQSIRIELRRVDMETGTFGDQTIKIQNSDQINRSIFTGFVVDQSMPTMLSLHNVEAGHYALVYMTASHENPVGSFMSWRCFADGAPVFFVPGGQISIVQMGEYWNNGRIGSQPTSMDDARTLRSFEEARIQYPGVQGEPVLVGPDSVIRWLRSGSETDPCVDASGFESFTMPEWRALADR